MRPWVGFDFDGTLVSYPPPAGRLYGDDYPSVVTQMRVIHNMGMTVKVVTARQLSDEFGMAVRKWLDDRGLHDVEVTDRKDYGMLLLFDDRVVTVQSGNLLSNPDYIAEKMKEIVQWASQDVPSLALSVNGPSASATSMGSLTE